MRLLNRSVLNDILNIRTILLTPSEAQIIKYFTYTLRLRLNSTLVI